jgi:hypothetical protein
LLTAEKTYAIFNGIKPYQCRWSANQHFRIFFPCFPENKFSLDFLFLLVVCSSEQRISPRPISAILERVSCLTGVKMPILQALQAKADRFRNPKSGSLSTNS